ncbi:hypothetical protein DL767_007804 [Monosporascus sp. MG133]|nr:hypothetical protein DL767_007804 [Monosporascus sp. MG133]
MHDDKTGNLAVPRYSVVLRDPVPSILRETRSSRGQTLPPYKRDITVYVTLDAALKALEDAYLRPLGDGRELNLAAIFDQGKLTPEAWDGTKRIQAALNNGVSGPDRAHAITYHDLDGSAANPNISQDTALETSPRLVSNVRFGEKLERDINAFAQANRRLYRLLNTYLYHYNIRRSGSSALLWAAQHGQEATAQKLLGQRADDQATNGCYWIPLCMAAERGHKGIVKLLLDKGADVNAQGGQYGNALQAASYTGHEQIVKLLLDKGADANAQGGKYGNAVQAASDGGHEQVVKLLLDKGADVNVQAGVYGNALQAALVGGHEQIVKLLLDQGADVNAQGGYYGNAVQAASLEGLGQIVKLLLDKGADVNAQGGLYGNALQAASFKGHEQIIKLLLDKDTH